MRHVVLALMIVLLPLRSWAGDAMATQMAGEAIAIESGSANAHKIKAKATFAHKNQGAESAQAIPDCHGQMARQSNIDDPASSDHSGTCQACQACHTVALSPSPVVLAKVFTSPQLRPTPGTTFTSAATALSQKPPIS